MGEKNGPDNEASANNLKKGHDGFEKTVSLKIAQQKKQNARAGDHLPSKADLVAQKCNNTHKVHLFSHNLEISVKRDFFSSQFRINMAALHLLDRQVLVKKLTGHVESGDNVNGGGNAINHHAAEKDVFVFISKSSFHGSQKLVGSIYITKKPTNLLVCLSVQVMNLTARDARSLLNLLSLYISVYAKSLTHVQARLTSDKHFSSA